MLRRWFKFWALVLVWGMLAATTTPKPKSDVFGEVLPKIREHAAWIFAQEPGWDTKLQQFYEQGARLGHRHVEAPEARALDQALRQVSAGAARFFTPADQEYFALASKFSGSLTAERYQQSGAWFARRGKRWFVEHVFGDSPAASAGLVRGDEIVTADGLDLKPVGSFINGGRVSLSYRRLPWDEPKQLQLSPHVTSTQELLLSAMRASARIVERKQRKIGVVWLTAASHESFHETLRQTCIRFQRDVDAMILDLRGDFAGGDLTYSDALVGDQSRFTKKLVVIVDEGTRGGREALAHLLQKSQRAIIVGATTKGDHMPGAALPTQKPLGALYLPTRPTDLSVRVSPDVPVDSPLVYAGGADPALLAALDAVTKD